MGLTILVLGFNGLSTKHIQHFGPRGMINVPSWHVESPFRSSLKEWGAGVFWPKMAALVCGPQCEVLLEHMVE